MTTPLYTWKGVYCAFIHNDRIFSANCDYLGWIDEDGRAFTADGEFWGDLVDENYILVRRSMARLARRARKATPARPATPARRAKRAARAARAGYDDGLEHLVE